MTDPANPRHKIQPRHAENIRRSIDGGPGISDCIRPRLSESRSEVQIVHDFGVEICMVIGGGNVFRGLQGSAQGMERTTADYMGMLATVMNALAMQSALEKAGGVLPGYLVPSGWMRWPSPISAGVRSATWRKKRVCIFAAGTGNPIFHN